MARRRPGRARVGGAGQSRAAIETYDEPRFVRPWALVEVSLQEIQCVCDGAQIWQDEEGYRDIVPIAGTNAFAAVRSDDTVDAFGPAGTLGWSTSLRAELVSQSLLGVACDAAGNVVAVGVQSAEGAASGWVAKLDPAGAVRWSVLRSRERRR